jgi:hypothetical protein
MATLCADLTVQGRIAACKRPIERGNVDGCCSSVTLHLHVLGWGVVRVTFCSCCELDEGLCN